MERQQHDVLTRAAVVATTMAVLGVVIPPVSIVFAVVAIVCSAMAMVRARRTGTTAPLARRCLLISVALIVAVVVGNAIYAAR